MSVLKHLIPGSIGYSSGGGVIWFPTRDISAESLIIGALEAAFWEMVKYCFLDNDNFRQYFVKRFATITFRGA